MVDRTLTVAQARRFYDRFGAKQDRQGWYEDAALDRMVAHAGFDRAGAVVEIGCGTGRFAERLLSELLPADASYLGLDLSQTMVDLSRERLRPFGARASVRLSDGSMQLPGADGCCDRVVSNYVVDLLPEGQILELVEQASRVLAPSGRLCLVSLGEGCSPVSRGTAALWRVVHRLRPQLVGGCRPLRLDSFVAGGQWRPVHSSRLSVRGLASEVMIVERS